MTARTVRLRETTYVPSPTIFDREEAYRAVKRIIDMCISLIMLILLAPVMAVIALLVVLDSPGPAIFRQKRVKGDQNSSGENLENSTFTLYKFRTMRADADQKLHREFVEKLIEQGNSANKQSNGLYKLAADPRVTRIGHFLRATSLDELPQLINVFKGDMSLVGPRPAIPYEVAKYNRWHRRRLEVTAGITGLWQVKGRNSLTFDEMVKLDNEYVENRSLRMDLAILLKTIPVVISKKSAC